MLFDMSSHSTSATVLPFGLLLVTSLAHADETPLPNAAPPAAAAPSGAATEPPAARPQVPASTGSAVSEGIVARGPVLRIPRGAEVREVALGCEGRAVLVVESRVYVACGDDGVAVVGLEPEPVLLGRIPTDGEAAGLFARAGKPWVELIRTEARPLGALRGQGPFLPPSVHAPSGGQATRTPEPAERPKLVAPPRVGDVTELSLGGAAFLTVGDLGVGMLAGAGIGHRFEAPFALRAEAYPIALGTGKQGAVGAFTGIGLASIDTTFFEIGLGLGAGKIPKSGRYDDSGTGTTVQSDGGGSVVAPTYVRIGARDGLYFSVRTSIIVRREEFAFGSVDVVGQIPVAERWAVVVRGEGGNMGSASGTASMRYRITETRGAGAAFIQGGGGYAYLEGDLRCEARTTVSGSYTSCFTASYSGPALAVAGEWRF